MLMLTIFNWNVPADFVYRTANITAGNCLSAESFHMRFALSDWRYSALSFA